eukprot:TRINITY_DN16508_c0_g2_i6.p2 TRINITY_DN16508_c0_g2~~TRINITY_DN16508_c0_g2_i6.p2  ORF type:complete len:196 (-),score=22.65 TRINITY_DN16508_c0_g2_i6:134-721(-)
MTSYEHNSKGAKYLTKVVNKKTSRQVFHLFTDIKDHISFENKTSHLKSFDDTSNWTMSRTVAWDLVFSKNIPVATGTEGHFFVQYQTKYSPSIIKIVWTEDYGETWKKPLIIERSLSRVPKFANHTIAICGKGKHERVISIDGKIKDARGFMKYIRPGQTQFRDLNYPFDEFRGMNALDMSCVYGDDGRYIITVI